MRTFFPIFEEAGGGQGGGGGDAASQAAAAAAKGANGGDAAAQAATATAAAAKASPFYRGFYGDDGKIDKASLERLPDHLKQHKDVFGKYDTIDALLSGFANANSLASKKQLTPLPDNAPDNVKAERKTLLDGVNNVPKEAKDYGISRPESLPPEHWDQPSADKFATLAHKHSISPTAVKELLALQTEMTQGQLAQGQQMETEFYQKQDQAFATEVQKRGVALDKANELAARGAATLGIDPKSPLFKNADVKLACLRLTNLISEDKLIKGDPQAGGEGDELARARDIASNPQNPKYKAYHDQMHPNHQAVRREWSDLYRADGERKQKRGIPAP